MNLINEIDCLVSHFKEYEKINVFFYGYFISYSFILNTDYSFTPVQKNLLESFFNKYFSTLKKDSSFFKDKTHEELKLIILDAYFSI